MAWVDEIVGEWEVHVLIDDSQIVVVLNELRRIVHVVDEAVEREFSLLFQIARLEPVYKVNNLVLCLIF